MASWPGGSANGPARKSPMVLAATAVLGSPAIPFRFCGLNALLDGLYKVEYGVNDAFGRSIMCMHDGKLLGGNSAFAHLGTYYERETARSSPR